MMKEFQHWCNHYINLFGLHQWKIEYIHEELNNENAIIRTHSGGKMAEISLSTKCTGNLRVIALHEILHLLLDRIHNLSKERFVSNREVDEADEEVVRTLTNVIRRFECSKNLTMLQKRKPLRSSSVSRKKR